MKRVLAGITREPQGKTEDAQNQHREQKGDARLAGGDGFVEGNFFGLAIDLLNGRATEFLGNILGTLVDAGEFHRAHEAIAHATMFALDDGGEHAVVAAIDNPMLGPEPRVVKGNSSAREREDQTPCGGGVPEPI